MSQQVIQGGCCCGCKCDIFPDSESAQKWCIGAGGVPIGEAIAVPWAQAIQLDDEGGSAIMADAYADCCTSLEDGGYAAAAGICESWVRLNPGNYRLTLSVTGDFPSAAMTGGLGGAIYEYGILTVTGQCFAATLSSGVSVSTQFSTDPNPTSSVQVDVTVPVGTTACLKARCQSGVYICISVLDPETLEYVVFGASEVTFSLTIEML